MLHQNQLIIGFKNKQNVMPCNVTCMYYCPAVGWLTVCTQQHSQLHSWNAAVSDLCFFHTHSSYLFSHTFYGDDTGYRKMKRSKMNNTDNFSTPAVSKSPCETQHCNRSFENGHRVESFPTSVLHSASNRMA